MQRTPNRMSVRPAAATPARSMAAVGSFFAAGMRKAALVMKQAPAEIAPGSEGGGSYLNWHSRHAVPR